MSTPDTAVREAAAKLHEAIVAAVAAGYRIHWPSNADGLATIAVSETGRVKPAAAPAEKKPATFGSPKL